MMRAVVDETQLAPAEGLRGLLIAFNGIGQTIQKFRNDEVDVYKHSRIWQTAVVEQTQLYEILFVDGYLDDDIRRLLSVTLSMLPDCDELNGVDSESARAFAVISIDGGIPCAVIVVGDRIRQEEYDKRKFFFVGDHQSILEFYREAAESGDFSQDEFIANAVRAFPNLAFAQNIAGQLGRFSQPYKAIRPLITKGLADLDDLLVPLLETGMQIREVERTFNAKSNFSISPESPLTHRNIKAMRERDVVFGTEMVRCEWHLKIYPERDRIHFNFDAPTVAPKKILVGIFTEHLTI